MKPDVLSRLFDPEPVAKEPEPLLPLSCVVGAVTWQIEKAIKLANGVAPPPSGCPENKLFVPADLRPQVIHWAHTSPLFCHPGVRRTMFAISRRFWWPSMEPEVREYVEACSVCARNKSSTGTRMGLLQPLPIPSRPWSDISLDFVTGLPVSQGNTTVLTVVDRFSKMVRFIALPKLPSAKETAEIIRQGDWVKRTADRKRRPAPDYQPGQRVWLSAKDLNLRVPSKRLAPWFVGPFPISQIINPAAVRLRLPRSLRAHPTFHVSQIKPVKDSPLVPAVTPPPPPEIVDGGPVYRVKKLLAVRNRGRGKQFLVDWEGYGPEERLWVPSRHIMDHTLIDDFYRDHPEQPGPSGCRS